MPLVTYIMKDTVVTDARDTLMDLLLGAAGYTNDLQKYSKGFFNTRTYHIDRPRPIIMRPLAQFVAGTQNVPKDYMHFRIPKASGGTRLIEAPNDSLKQVQRRIADMMMIDYKILPHNAAYAYTRGRCAYDSLVTHQRNNARWFLKLDIKDFFPSITKEVLKEQLPKIYPLCLINKDAVFYDNLTHVATNADNVLPQGSPLSPLLSNLIMVEFDLKLTKALRRFNYQTYTYTRYADDMLISCPYEFKYQDIIDAIEELFKELNLPFVIARHKVRYASSAGRNWNLGLMYNYEQKITVGSKRKKELHSLLNSFVVEYPWDKQSTQELLGKLAYIRNVEPEYTDSMITKYNTKYSVDVRKMFTDILRD